jgi:hypothetical protein
VAGAEGDVALAGLLVRMRIYSSGVLGSNISEVRGDMTVKLLERNDKSNLKVSDFKAGEIMQAGRGENVETGGLILL